MCTEAVPGDRFNISCESLIRFAPLVSPVMHRMDVTMHYFFVPNRLVWPGWEDFITSSATVAAPYIRIDGTSYTDLADYMGIPNPIGIVQEEVNAIPFAAYQMIYNEYYRDQNLQTEVNFELVDGNNSTNGDLLDIRNRCWEHDYFTAALPFAQKGNAVDLPIGEVVLKDPWAGSSNHPVFRADDLTLGDGDITQTNVGAGAILSTTTGANRLAYDPDGTLETEATTINDLRRAFRLQEWMELAARAGSRYKENIWAFFGIDSGDARLQRPEYITGIKSPVVISEVLNTTGDAGTGLPQGNMAGHGISVTSGKYGNYTAREHGYIIGVMSVMPKTAYQQGIPKHFLKTDPFDYFWPQFAHIGEQEVLNKEVYAFDAAGGNTFGYVPRYAEYKFEQSRVAGDFRTTLDFWHLGRKFSAAPALNSAFVEADPTHRVFAVTDPNQEKLYCHVYNKVKAVRPMPKFGTPSF